MYSEQALFSSGSEPSLAEVLDRREARVETIRRMLAQAPTVLCMKLNIPGPIKDNAMLRELFDHAAAAVEAEAEAWTVRCRLCYRGRTGSELFLGLDAPAEAVKRRMVALESTALGRLYDIDVENASGAVSRTALGFSERRCFLCDEPAKLCARSRRHSVAEMQAWIIALLEENGMESALQAECPARKIKKNAADLE